MGYQGRDHRQGGEDFFSNKNRGAQTFFRKKLGGGNFFSKKISGRRLFSKKIRGGKDFFTKKIENPRIHISKKAIFEDQKVMYVVGWSDLSVFIGVWYI